MTARRKRSAAESSRARPPDSVDDFLRALDPPLASTLVFVRRAGTVTLRDPRRLVEWLAPDRGVVRFHHGDDAREKSAALQELLREWIGQLHLS